MIDARTDRTWVVVLFCFSLFMFTRSLALHGVEYRDDEIFYYQSTNEMLREGNYLSPTYFGENRFQKPILFYWFVILFYKILGVNWFAARLTAAIFAAGCIVLTYLLAREFFSRRVAALSGFLLMSTPLFLRHAKNVVPDMALNFFIIAAIYCGIRYTNDLSKRNWIYGFYVLCALGFMVKGIAALAVPLGAMTIFLLLSRKASLKAMRIAEGIGIWLALSLPWFLYMIVRHGGGYLEYMVVEETRNRILGTESNILWNQGKRFIRQALFYSRTMLVYFLPWSLIALAAFPTLVLRRDRMPAKEREGFLLCLGWVLLVFFIFANMYFAISHYMLVLTAPFAILVAYFMLDHFTGPTTMARMRWSFNVMLLFIFGISLALFGFLAVFLAGEPMGWLPFIAIVYLAVFVGVARSATSLTAAVAVSILIMFVYSQTAVMAKAGVSSHATLQRFARIIHEQPVSDYVVGVGSHDIHEKEFQVYFDRPLIKAGHSHAGAMEYYMRQLIDGNDEVYCLLTEKDYNEYSFIFEKHETEVLAREFMVRKRMRLDRRFLEAFLRFDDATVREYLLEEVVLVRKR